MTEKQQTILRILGLIAVAGLMGLTLYTLFFSGGPKVTPDETVSETPGTSSGLPSANNGRPTPDNGSETTSNQTDSDTLKPSPVADGGLTQTTQLTTGSIVNPTVTAGGKMAYYDPHDGKFYTVDDKGNVVLLAQGTFPAAQSVVFAKNAEAAVLEFPDGSNVVYNFNSGQQSTLPSHWQDFSFSSDSTSIAAKSVGNDPSNRSLVISSVDGSVAKSIAPLGDSDDRVSVDWSPSGNIVGFSKTGSSGNAFGQNEIYLIDQNGEAAGVLVVNGSNFKSIWSPTGSNLLYSVADAGDEYRASLWYADSRGDRTGDTRVRINIKTTADKCTFASNTLAYCAVPTEMPSGGGSTPSLITANDNIYSVSFPSGRTSLVAIPDQNTKITHLTVSGGGDQLFYTDTSGRLNVIQLK